MVGTAADTATIRIGIDQNQTFIAGIHGPQWTGSAVQVFVDANGQLGTITAPAVGSGTTPLPVAAAQQVQEQQAINAELRARIATREARLEALAVAAARRR